MRIGTLTTLLGLVACNPLPEGNAVSLTPDAPLTGDDLVVVLDGDLGDADKVTWTWTWSKEGQVQADLDTDTVPSARTRKGETWEVSVQATAGKKESEPLVASVTIGNTPPVGESANLGPAEPSTLASVTVTPAGSDADQDALTWTYAWEINGSAVDGADGDTLDASYTARGDVIQVTATPNDGSDDGQPVTSSPLTVVNTAPSPPSIAIDPVDPDASEDLLCEIVADGLDVDEDPLTYTVTWTVDGLAYSGVVETTRIAGDTVPASATATDQVWTCTVATTDGTDSAPDVTSEPVTIAAVVLEPGVVDVAATLDGYSVRCHAWEGDVCVQIQQQIACDACGEFTDCGEWHDTTVYNNHRQRTSRNFCMLATGVPDVVSEGEGGPLLGPAACGWSASDHPYCFADRASIVVPGATDDPELGLLIRSEYCDNTPTLLTVECAGW